MTEPKPTYTDDMGVNCPACGVAITIGNAGGYRTYCEGCCISGDGYTLYVDDCKNVMEGIADGTIDLTVTSPPYDNLRDYGKGFDADSFDWHPIIAELYRVTAVGGVVVWVVADATVNGSETGTSFKQALWAMECGFRLHDTMIYETDKPPMNDNRYQACFEYMFVFSKGAVKAFNPIMVKSKNAGKKRTSITYRQQNGETSKQWRGGVVNSTTIKKSIWKFLNSGQVKDEKRKNHPASFPEALANDHIISWSNPGDLVFDCFLGSGTTGKMAIHNGRKFIGCDIEAEYVDIARQRIENEVTAVRNRNGQYETTAAEKKTGQVAIWDMLS